MRKALRIVAISAGIVSVVSAVILGCVYFEDITGYIKKIKSKISANGGSKCIDKNCDCK